jgi:hypothetical protein
MVGTTFCLFILLTDRGLKSDLANDTDRLLGSVRHFLEECELSPDEELNFLFGVLIISIVNIS